MIIFIESHQIFFDRMISFMIFMHYYIIFDSLCLEVLTIRLILLLLNLIIVKYITFYNL